ncbi:C40 family peptidase [Paenibacillus sp. y28]|uniref:C40 family peptidase n=1 Tax=Paenibacillus sp. y28 TaxID=3129110 RepID=UPI0030166917
MIGRTFLMSAVLAAALTGTIAGSAYAANDDMDAASLARKLVGQEYTGYGTSPSNGFDAAGLTYYIFDQLGYTIPKSLDDQYGVNKPLVSTISDIKAGDVLFFGSKSNPTYSGIAAGNGEMVLASKSSNEVIKTKINDYKDSFIGGRRILSSNDQLRVQLVLEARKYLGTPYDFGAKYGQTKTFDCSSFMKTIFAAYDIKLPRVSRDQAKEGSYVSKSNLKVGDLVFFTTPDSGSRIGHVGLYVGDGQMIHTYGEGGVKYTSISKEWWKDHYVTARRVIK